MTDRSALPSRPPPPRPLAAWAFSHYVSGLARKSFASVRWRSESDWQHWDPGIATLVIANHSNWWDGFIAHELTRAMQRHFFILMEQQNLDRYRGFRWIGALPLERRRPMQAMRDLATATAALTPDALMWIFPQGMRRPANETPARFERGAEWMTLRHGAPLRVVPCALRYPFLSEQWPECLVLLGTPWLVEPGARPDPGAVTARFETMIQSTLASLDRALRSETLEGYATLIAGPPSINNRVDAFRHRLGLLKEFNHRNG